MTLPGSNRIRLLWLLDLFFLLAALLPGLMGHPYPKPFHPYVEYAGIFIYTAGALCIVALVSRRRKLVAK